MLTLRRTPLISTSSSIARRSCLQEFYVFFYRARIANLPIAQSMIYRNVHPTCIPNCKPTVLFDSWYRNRSIPLPTCIGGFARLLQDAEETVRRRSCLVADLARRGYAPMNVENFAALLVEQGSNDLVRKFCLGPLRSQWVDNTSSSNALLQENIWPPINLWDKAMAFQAMVESNNEAACTAAQGVVRAICNGLLQSQHDLQASLQPLLVGSEQSTSTLNLLGYRSGTRHKSKNKGPLVAAHTDVGVVTMLLFDGGSRTCAQLQRSDGQGGWVDVELPSEVPSDPIFVLNVTGYISDSSQKRLPSTLHRVVARHELTIPRNCCALFVSLDSATQLSMDNNETISCEEWRRRRIVAQMVLRPNGIKRFKPA
jgi:isopenicillin N synthase-like dioxygenase